MLLLDDLLRDLKYGFRMARNAKLISIAVVLTLALGIGINSGVFTLINGMLLRPRTDSDPATFARLYAQYWSLGNPREFGGQFSVAAYRALASQTRVLNELAAWRTDRALIEEDATGTLALEVSCNFFSVYGLTHTKTGRLFRSDECTPGAEAPVVVLSEEEWRDRFAGDPGILGKAILLNRESFTVIGIVPADFSGRLRGPGIWIPYTMQHRLTSNEDIFHADKTPSLWLEGRLRSPGTRDQLAAEANVMVSRVATTDPDLKQRVFVTSGALIEDPAVRADRYWILALIVTGAMLLLLVSCASGAVLLLSRAAARRQEIAVRISLGAARRRVLRQLLCENLLLAVAAGAIGIYIALEIPRAFRKMLPAMPHFPFSLDWHIFSYVAAITLAACVISGLVPAAECLRQDVWNSLKGQELTLKAARLRWNLRDLLVIVQVCLCVVLMVVAAMFSRAVLDIFGTEPGFETRQVLTVPFRLAPDRYDLVAAGAFYRAFEERLARLPMVETVATSDSSPLDQATGDSGSGGGSFRLPSQTSLQAHQAMQRTVSPNYFSALDIPVVRGEVFRNALSDENAVVVSQSFAAAFWPANGPNGDPIGQIVIAPDGKPRRVLGVVRDTRTAYTSAPDGPTLYTLRRTPVRGDLLLVRFRGDVAVMATAVKQIVRDLDSQMLVLSSTLRAQIEENAEKAWLIGKMLLFVAFVAASLALLGIYGVVGYSVTRRTREFGIRAALGATRRDLMALVFTSGVRPVVAGSILGVLCAFVFSLAVATALRGAPLPLSPASPVSYGIVCTLLLLATLLATIGHARRAAAVQPIEALREE